MFVCAGPASSSAICEETVEIPQLQLVEFWTVVACPLCATTGAVWSMTLRSSVRVMDVLVIMQRRLVATVENATDSVHRRFQFATDGHPTFTSGGYGGDEREGFGLFRPF